MDCASTLSDSDSPFARMMRKASCRVSSGPSVANASMQIFVVLTTFQKPVKVHIGRKVLRLARDFKQPKGRADVSQVVLRLARQPLIVRNGGSYLVALFAEREDRNRIAHAPNLGAEGIHFLWHLRQHTEIQWLGD